MVTRLTGGLSPGDGGDPRTFPAVYDELVDAVEAVTPVPDPALQADGRMLHVASGTLAYTDPPSGVLASAPYGTPTARNAYGVPGVVITSANLSNGYGPNQVIYQPMVAREAIKLTKVARRTISNPTNDILVRFGLYAGDPNTFEPTGTSLYDHEITVASGTSPGTIISQVLSQTLPAGLYFAAVVTNNGAFGNFTWHTSAAELSDGSFVLPPFDASRLVSFATMSYGPFGAAITPSNLSQLQGRVSQYFQWELA
jgi:hypothetical protein